ncbi:hypothetical protein SUDANB95_07747 [Actinosynnema sp. ALI-1.44]
MTFPQASPMPPAPIPNTPKPTRFGGLAWTALILGIVGVIGSPVIFLNNVTAVVAGVGVVLGVIALFGTRKVLAAIGTVLCVLGIVFTVMAQAAAVAELDRILDGTTNEGQVGTPGGDTPAAAADTPPTWGQRYTWQDGLAVEVSAPTSCTPGEYSAPPDVARGAKVTVTVINGTDKAFEAGLLSVGGDAQFEGRKADKIHDRNGPCGGGGLDNATVLPGKTYTFETAYAVGEQPGELQITLQPTFGADKAVFVGRA